MDTPPPTGPLSGLGVVCLATNVPGPIAAARLGALGMTLIKVEPPAGDHLARLVPDWYAEINRDATITRLDLKTDAGRADFAGLLGAADVLITSHRPSSLARLGITADRLAAAHPRLCWVEIVGDTTAPETPGHDLTYQATAGLVTGSELPRTLVADLAGAEAAAGAAAALVAGRERGRSERHVVVGLRQAGERFAAPVRHGATTPGGPLSGALPQYRTYRLVDGWAACAALEPAFLARLQALAGDDFDGFFGRLTSAQCRELAARHDLPLVAF